MVMIQLYILWFNCKYYGDGMVCECRLWYGKPKLTYPDLEQIGTWLSYEGWTDEEKEKDSMQH